MKPTESGLDNFENVINFDKKYINIFYKNFMQLKYDIKVDLLHVILQNHNFCLFVKRDIDNQSAHS